MFRAGTELNYFEERNGKLLNKQASLWFSYSGTMQSNLYLRGWRTREAYKDAEFDLTYFLVQGGFWPTSNLQVNAATVFGDQIDYANTRLGKRFRLNPGLTYNIGRHLRLSFNHNYERMSVQDAHLYTANISGLSAVYQFNVRAFFRAIVQYVYYDYNPSNYTFEIESEYKRLFTQLLFSYKINPRIVLFIGYSDNSFGGDDFSLTQSDRTFFIKMGYAWVF
jgi:hypothetical protein